MGLGAVLVVVLIAAHSHIAHCQTAKELVAATPSAANHFRALTGKSAADALPEFKQWLFGHGSKRDGGLNELYEFMWDINAFKSILEEEEGWNVYWRTSYEDFKKMHTRNAVRVAIQGVYNRGKSFVLNALSGGNLPKGYTNRTVGVSVTVLDKQNLLFMNTAGSRVPVKQENQALVDRQTTDAFLQDLIFQVADVNLVVVNQLTLDDQIFLQRLRQRLEVASGSDAEVKKRLYLFHNFKDLETVEDVQKAIQQDITSIFNASLQEKGNFGKYYESRDFFHFVFARQDTPAGDFYNEDTLTVLKHSILFHSLDQRPIANILNTLMEAGQTLLSRYLEKPSHTEVSAARKASRDRSIVKRLYSKLFGDPAHTQRARRDAEQPHIGDPVALNLVYNAGDADELPRTVLHSKDSDIDHVRISRLVRFDQAGSVFLDQERFFTPEMQMSMNEQEDAIEVAVALPGVTDLECTFFPDRIELIGIRNTTIKAGFRLQTSPMKGGHFHLEFPLPFVAAREDREDMLELCESPNALDTGVLTLTFRKENPIGGKFRSRTRPEV